MKFLVIRFSSIGDVTQALSLPAHIRHHYPDAKVHFLTKKSFEPLMLNHPHIHHVWTIESNMSLGALVKMALQLNSQDYDFVYDAHNNLRSNLFYFIISARKKLQKPMQRWKRFLLLQFKINQFEKPLSGQRDLLKPLAAWGIPFQLPAAPQLFLRAEVLEKVQSLLDTHKVKTDFIAVAPSAAHIFKRWPVEKWKKLFESLPEYQFVVLAGPEDVFTKEFEIYPHVVNLAGKTSLLESAAVIQLASKVISNDTGLLHFSEQLGKKTIALMGAAPFGFPSRESTFIIKKDVSCWPCSKHGQGPCVNPEYFKCMNDITAAEVKQKLESV